jgi:hypothetical protein
MYFCNSITFQDTKYGCFPGRVYKQHECRLAIPFQRNIRYSLHILSMMKIVSRSNDSNVFLSEIRDSVLDYLDKDSISNECYFQGLFFLPKSPLAMSYINGLYHFQVNVILHITFLYLDVFDRDKVERMLLRYPRLLSLYENGTPDKHYLYFELKGITLANMSETMLSTDMHILPKEHLSFIQEFKDIAYFDVSFHDILVQELLICIHRKIPVEDTLLDTENYRLIVLDTQEIFYVGEYTLDLNDIVGVCAPSLPSTVRMTSTLTEELQTLTTVLNIVSTIGLIILLVIYLSIPSLQTLPGLNNMGLIASLILMQVTYTITNTFEKITLKCVIGGVLLHYFWLCMCCCLFICCFCMWRSFCNPITGRASQSRARIFTGYMVFSYATPLIVVAGNATIVYILYGDIGYGKKVCFVDNRISNIVTFVFPLSFICLVNTVLFFHTISKIQINKTIRKSKQDTSELIIFGKLFSLTGSVWIMQVIDGFFPQITAFSFIATVLTSSQGLCIFLSFVTSPQIIKQIKCWGNGSSKT